ncbi:alpha/beta fold hydrolase [Pseudomonas sp. PIC25]|uniref:alpha/beta fold hydrolase n=1 Tax=Pseudomonas sp. PIC25 TaxID=1958773 RepID=UPI002113951B|nr:alpha/beta fold hydrolase [Pseudomonas sp. PIC25]
MTTLILLPGMDGTGLLFQPFIDALPDDIRVMVVHYPIDETLGYQALRSYVEAALPEGPLVLLGESFSGPIATAIAASCADRVRGLVLCCTFVQNPRPLLGRFKALLPLLPIRSVPGSLIAALLLGRFATPALRSLLEHALSRVSPSVLRARLRAVSSVDESASLLAAKAPVLYLRATEDRLVPAANARLIEQLCSSVHVMPISGPHCLLQACPAEAVAAIDSFLREVESRHLYSEQASM